MIPNTFHHIWINQSEPALPEPFAGYRRSWMQHHPHWDFRLWNVEAIDFELRRSDLLARCGSYAQTADVLRLELLYRLGGVYVDTDFECFKPIDLLLAGARTVFCSENGAVISNSFIAAEAGSPLILRLLDRLPQTLGGPYPNQETGPGFFTRELLGMGFGEEVRLLPSRYLYPYSMGQSRATAETHPEAYAAHHWAHSWAPARPKFSPRFVAQRLRARLQGALART